MNTKFLSGQIMNGKQTIVRTYGDGVHVQTTALAMLVWMKYDRVEYAEKLERSLSYIIGKRILKDIN
jgi:hypothetical protein